MMIAHFQLTKIDRAIVLCDKMNLLMYRLESLPDITFLEHFSMETKMTDRAQKLTALTIACSSQFLIPFMGSSINLALPSIQKEFNTDAVLLSWVATAFLLASAVSLVPFGKLADIHGRKKFYLAGMITITITSILSACATSVPMLIFFRIFLGAGAAMTFATGIAILTSVYPPAERGKVLGISVAAVYVGLTCAPLVGGWLTQHFTWRSIFIVIVPPGIFVILLLLLKLKGEWADSKGEAFDLTGSFIYGISIIALIYGISKLPSGLSIAFVVIGIVLMVIFVKWELKVQFPVFEVKLFKTNRIFAFSSMAALIHYSSTFGSTFLMSLYLQYIKGFSPQAAGMILIFQPVMMAALSPISGRMSDKIEPRVLSTLGMACTALGLALLIFLSSNTALLYIIIALAIAGIGFALFSSPNVNAIMSSVEKRHYGIASGSMGTMRLVGQMLSMAIVTMIFTLLIGKVEISPEHYPALLKSIKTAYIIFTCLCASGIYFSLSRGNIRQETK